jgi:hypothetical protein
MSTLERRVAELREEPSRWSGYDEATRELLKRQARVEVLRLGFDPLTGDKRWE